MFKIVLFDDTSKIAEYKSRNVYNVLSAIIYVVNKKYGYRKS